MWKWGHLVDFCRLVSVHRCLAYCSSRAGFTEFVHSAVPSSNSRSFRYSFVQFSFIPVFFRPILVHSAILSSRSRSFGYSFVPFSFIQLFFRPILVHSAILSSCFRSFSYSFVPFSFIYCFILYNFAFLFVNSLIR